MPFPDMYRPMRAHEALGSDFFDPVSAADFPAHRLRYRNERASAEVGLQELSDAEWVSHFGRFEPLPETFPQPLALRYHGHQFRSYNPDLGDGRGFLFAQLYDRGGRLMDLGTKGSGQTPWSRGGDGRLTLKGGVRELLATSMLEALGVPTSRTFSLVETGEALMRGDEPSPTRSSVLVRLSHSHIRIGTFQRLAYLEDHENIRRLIDHVVRHYYPDCRRDEEAVQALAMLAAVTRAVAETGAAWMAAGFVHGVLNTDNINVTGESFDYGPWRFLPVLDPAFVAAYFDQFGLYAFGRQPETLLWNLARLAECLLPFTSQEELEKVVRLFPELYREAFDRQLIRRLGLKPRDGSSDRALAEAFWRFLAASAMPFEQAFFDWFGGKARPERAARSPHAAHYESEAFVSVRDALEGYEPADVALLDHDFFKRPAPVTMLIEDVERLWQSIDEDDDWAPLQHQLDETDAMREAYGLSGR